MEDYSVIRGQTMVLWMFAFLLTAVSSYLYTRWLATRRKIQKVDWKQVLTELSIVDRLRMNVMRYSLSLFRRRRPRPQAKFALVGEWLAPMIAWLVVALAGLAVLNLLVAQ